jgi:hypothetical protein
VSKKQLGIWFFYTFGSLLIPVILAVMRKNFFTVILLLMVFHQVFGQTATSVQNGNWYNPTTWDCTCIPLPAYTISINHEVLLDNDFVLNGGSITIGNTGTLKENLSGRHLVMNSGSVANNGKLKIGRVAFYGGEFYNYDSCIVSSVFFCDADALNEGSISGVDSLVIQSYFYNDATGTIDAFQVLLNDTLENDGTLNATDFLNLDVFLNYNEANFHNFFSNHFTENDNLITFNDFTNKGEFWNYGEMDGEADFMNVGYFYNDTTGTVSLGNDFSNIDSLNHLAYLEINGGFYVEGNFFNKDTISGDIGHICVKNASTNEGKMLGTFDFCDLTGSGSTDLNTGFISNGITYCQTPCFETIGEMISNTDEILAYPNPSNGEVHLVFPNNPENATFIIIDIQGKKVFHKKGIISNIIIPEGYLNPGLYMYHLTSGSKAISGKLIIE